MLQVSVSPPQRQSTVSVDAQGLLIVIPARRSVFLVLFLTAWLAIWGMSEFLGARRLVVGPRPTEWILVLWFAAWTYIGAWTVYAWLWITFGKEIVKLCPPSLTIKRDVLGMGITRAYELAQIRNLRASLPYANPYDWVGTGAGLFQGTLAFDYGAKTFRFGVGLPEAEASQIIGDLKRYSPIGDAA